VGLFARWYLVACVTVCCVGLAGAQGSFVNFENPHCHPIDVSPDNSTLATVNTAANRVDLWDLTSGVPVFTKAVPVGYDPVTARWRTNNELWVVNHISDTISVVDVANAIITQTIETLEEPCDVVFAGTTQRAFVSCSFVNTIQIFNPTTFAETGQVAVAAEDPRGLAVSADGTKVYAAIFESGNGTTLIFGAGVAGSGFPPTSAMFDPSNPYRGQSPPPNINVSAFQSSSIEWRPPDPANQDTNLDWTAESANYFSPPLSLSAQNMLAPVVSHIVQDDGTGTWLDDNGEDWTPWVSGASAHLSGRYPGWTLVDRDIAIIDANNPTGVAVEYVERLMNHNMAIGVNPNNGDITVVGTDATNVIRFEPNIEGTFTRVNIAIVEAGDIVNGKTIKDLNAEHLAQAQFLHNGAPDLNQPYFDGHVPQAERDKSIGDPRSIVWNAAGTRGFIAGMGSNNLVIVDNTGDRFMTGYTVELQEGPTGVAIDESRGQLYAMNRFDGSITVVDISTPGAEFASATIPFFDPTPQVIKDGRKHLYDTHKNSGLGQIACASCHIDSRKDRLAWDLGDPSVDVKPLDLITMSGDFAHPHNSLFPGSSLDDFHPLKGPMTTQTLQDIIGKEPLHWRGDRDGLEEFNGAFVALQGGSLLTPTEMQEFEDFLATTHFPPNPFRNLDNTLPTDLPLVREFSDGKFSGSGGLNEGDPMPNGNAVNGLAVYRRQGVTAADAGSLSCVVCHTLPIGNSTDLFFDGLNVHVIPPGPNGEAKLGLFDQDGSDQRTFKVPQTRAIFDKAGMQMIPGVESLAGFGLFHDGGIDSITRFVSEDVFTGIQNDQEIADLVALQFAFSGGFDVTSVPGEFPITQTSLDAHAAVGKQVTVNSSSPNAFLNSLIAEAANTNNDAFQIDLIAKTTVNVHGLGDVVRGWVYDEGTDTFLPDQGASPGLTQAELLALAAPGAEITFTAVPLGTGVRLGIDRDEDGIRDFDEVRDLDPFQPGVQNPFDPDNADSTGDDGSGPDGTPDGLNDYDNDGIDNATEFNTPGGTPIGLSPFAGLPATQNWGLAITLLLMAGALAVAGIALRRRTT
jgi:YVTN family beta-propeller protein